MTALEVKGVTKSYGAPPVAALSDIDLTAMPGSFVAVAGASGSGKSTLLRILGGLTAPTAGSVSVFGRSPDQIRAAKGVGWMAQQPALLPWRSVQDNVALAQQINPQPGRAVLPPRELLEMVGLGNVGQAYPGQLSGGMQQRVALARTLAIGAPLWLMDEPFASLDEITRETLADDLLRLWAEVRTTVVWVTHHIPEAIALADTVMLLTPGPGTVAGVIDVDLPRPRDATSTAFQDLVRAARSTLRQVRQPQAVP